MPISVPPSAVTYLDLQLAVGGLRACNPRCLMGPKSLKMQRYLVKRCFCALGDKNKGFIPQLLFNFLFRVRLDRSASGASVVFIASRGIGASYPRCPMGLKTLKMPKYLVKKCSWVLWGIKTKDLYPNYLPICFSESDQSAYF